MTEDWRRAGFGVYVHWPFCAAKCPYCDFNSHVRAGVDQDRWRRALVSEVRAAGAMVPGRRVDTVFFGGGTPSLMPPETVGAVIEAIAEVWTLAEDAEITLEANPTSVEAGRFRGYRDAGVNRVSLGIQALNDADLHALGRMHSAAEARAALGIARDTFQRVSFDLIYARQGQSLEAWRAELTEALTMAGDHLSLYQLTIEDGTRFGDLAARGRLRGLPDTDLSADLYLATQELCDAAGLPAYEVSNHARPGGESRHNLIYWRHGDYAGIGPGAHGRLTLAEGRMATETAARPEDWLGRVEAGGTGITAMEPIAPADQAAELLLMGLRLREGIDAERYASLAGRALDTDAIRDLERDQLIVYIDNNLRATESGRLLLNRVIAALAA